MAPGMYSNLLENLTTPTKNMFSGIGTYSSNSTGLR